MTDEVGLGEKAEKLEKAAVKLTESHEEAIAVCSIAQSLLTRRAAQFDVLRGGHIQEEGDKGERQ